MSQATIKLLKHLGISSLSGAAFAIGSAVAGALLDEVMRVIEGEEEKVINGFKPEETQL